MRRLGWRVFASCRKPDDCTRLRAEGFEAPRIDLADTASITSGVAQVLESTGGRLDGLFNNGAFATPGLVEDLPADALRSIFETNVFGTHELTRQVIPVMRAQGAGRIVMNSSVLGFSALPWRGAYNASKFALTGLTDTLRLEMRGSGLHIALIEPGPITTEIRKNSIPHFERWITPDETARAEDYRAMHGALYGEGGPGRFELPPAAVSRKLEHALTARRPRPRYFVTTPTHITGLLHRLLPTRALDWIRLRL